MKGDMTINGYDAYETWGINPDSTALSALMTPPGMKDLLSIDSRLSNGRTLVNNNPKVASRDVTLSLSLVAPTEAEFFSRYNAFCTELAKGKLEISTKYQDGVTYRFYYLSCTQFSQYSRGLAKFSLKLTEPDPTNRS